MTHRADFPILLIIADGWPNGVFLDTLGRGELPEIEELLLPRAVHFRSVISVFPSLSFCSHTTLLSGTNQAKHGIPGHRWFSRQDNQTRNYIGLGARSVNEDIDPGVKLLFERFPRRRAIAIQSLVRRGAHRTVTLPTVDSEVLLRKTAKTLTRDPSAVVTTWLPRGDVVSHRHGPNSPALVDEMRRTSRGIGVLVHALRRDGLFDDARILLTSDHGQRAVSKSADLSKFFRARGFTSRLNPRTPGRHDVSVLSSGHSAAYVYFRSPALTASPPLELLEELTGAPGVGLVFVRMDSDHHLVLSREGRGTIDRLPDSTVRYEAGGASDPLGLVAPGESATFDLSAPSPEAAAQRYPDLLHQYLTSFVPRRSANVLVTASGEYHFGKTPSLGFRAGFHRGTHGGPSRDEMLFSSIATGLGVTGTVSRPIRSSSLLPIWLGDDELPELDLPARR